MEQGVKAVFTQTIKRFTSLSRELKVSPKACVTINQKGLKFEYSVDTASILIGIGDNHTAELLMDVEALEAFKSGAEIRIETLKELKKKYL